MGGYSLHCWGGAVKNVGRQTVGADETQFRMSFAVGSAVSPENFFAEWAFRATFGKFGKIDAGEPGRRCLYELCSYWSAGLVRRMIR